MLERLHRDLAEHLEDGEAPDEAVVACVQLGLSRPPLGAVPPERPPPAPMLVSAFGMQLHRVRAWRLLALSDAALRAR